jgi:hypothetical protein
MRPALWKGNVTVDSRVWNGTPRRTRHRRGRSLGTPPLVTIIEAVLAGVAGVYLTTGSVAITIVAAALAVIVVTVMLVTQR